MGRDHVGKGGGLELCTLAVHETVRKVQQMLWKTVGWVMQRDYVGNLKKTFLISENVLLFKCPSKT